MECTAADELRRRRERGRLAQAEFRKRQAKAAQDVKLQNRLLQDAIENIVQATHGDEHPDLLSAIQAAAEAAGTKASRTAPPHSIDKVRAGCPDEESQSSMRHRGSYGEICVDFTRKDFVGPETLSSISFTTLSRAAPQRLNCGLWLDPLQYIRVSLPPEDIIPYLGSGSETFSGRIFWAIMSHYRNGCQGKHDEAPILSTFLVRKKHSKTLQDAESRYFQAMVEARLEYKQTGFISPQYAAGAESELGMAMFDQITEDHHANGNQASGWLSSLAIEKRLRSMVSETLFGLMEKAARGDGEPVLSELMNNIICSLFDRCNCFGDGPRWNADVVDGLFAQWIRTATTISALDEVDMDFIC